LQQTVYKITDHLQKYKTLNISLRKSLSGADLPGRILFGSELSWGRSCRFVL